LRVSKSDDIEPHPHVRCIHYGRVADVHDGPIEPAVHNITSAGGSEIISCHLEFMGVCPDGRRVQADDARLEPPDPPDKESRDG
jgi:Fe2+ or Zn2+ uptake regulation protein